MFAWQRSCGYGLAEDVLTMRLPDCASVTGLVGRSAAVLWVGR